MVQCLVALEVGGEAGGGGGGVLEGSYYTRVLAGMLYNGVSAPALLV
jgi:hypothetical protein